jgi:hypothetical protein
VDGCLVIVMVTGSITLNSIGELIAPSQTRTARMRDKDVAVTERPEKLATPRLSVKVEREPANVAYRG